MLPGMLRAARARRARSSSRWGGSDKGWGVALSSPDRPGPAGRSDAQRGSCGPRRKVRQRLVETLEELVLRGIHRVSDHRDEIGTRGNSTASIELLECGAQPAAAAVTADRAGRAPRDGHRNFGSICISRYVHHGEPTPTDPVTLRTQSGEGLAPTNPSDHAERRARPLRRRARRTERPALVDIRLRKPCFFDRLRTFG